MPFMRAPNCATGPLGEGNEPQSYHEVPPSDDREDVTNAPARRGKEERRGKIAILLDLLLVCAIISAALIGA